MTNKRIIVLQPFCACVMEIVCRERLEKICDAHINNYLFQYGHTRTKGTQEALFVHRRWLECRKAVGLDTYALNLDVKKAFDKMSPTMIYPLLRKLGAPPTLITAIEHLYKTRTMTFKNSTAKVGHTEYRTLLMQGGALGPTMYKCLKLGVMLSLQKDKVWTVDYELGAALYRISNMDSLSRRAKRRRKKKKGKKDRTLLLQKCLQAGYNRMEGWRHCAKECETSHKQIITNTTTSHTQTRERYNSIYTTSTNININTTSTQH